MKNFLHAASLLVIWAAMGLVAVTGALAQTTTGTVKGTVTDNSGAVVPAAAVTLTGGGVQKSTQTQVDGGYTFLGLAPGQYTVRFTYPGFTPFEKAVTVTGGGTVQLPIQLALSTEKQEVTVNAEAGPNVSVEPDNNATALVLKAQDLEALPDDPDDLSDALQALAGPGAGPNGGSLYIDGFTGGQLPPKESIREIRINQNPFSAEYDKLGFGRIEILTKPGSDKLRGNLNFNDSDAEFNSRNPFASNKPDYSNRQFGANFGGPINARASYFVDFNRRDIQDNAVTFAQYFDPTTFQPVPVTTAVVTPLTNTLIAPRMDYQLSSNHTLTVRFEERLNSRENNGLGKYNLPPGIGGSQLAYNTSGGGQNLQATETAVLSPKMINETRFQFVRNLTNTLGNLIPQIDVAGEFVTGGNGYGNASDLTHHYELQNYTTITLGTHTVRFGGRLRRDSDLSNNPQGFNGTFTFTGGTEPVLDANNQIVMVNGEPQTAKIDALTQYERNLRLQQAGFTGAQIQALGGGPTKFTIQGGQSYISLVRWDAGPFVQDDWRVKPNLTLSLGLRYEVQNLFSDYHDIAPRIGVAWAPGTARNGRQKTVIRGGFGIFYDRINFVPFERAFLNNGLNQLQYNVDYPTFYPNIPSLSSLSPGQNSIYTIDPNLRADASLQAAAGVERQLPRNTTLAINYTFTRTNHLAQTVPVNSPLPGTFDPALPLGPDNGLYPLGYAAGRIFQYESGGFLKQHLLSFNLNTRFSRRVSMFVNYALQYANDLPATPSDPYNFAIDYGRSILDRRNNVQIVGSVEAPLGLRLAPFVTIRSGGPYDVSLGTDLYDDTYYNARPAFAPSGACPAGFIGTVGTIACTSRGAFQTGVLPGQTADLIPRNYLTADGLFSINVRLYRVFGFGPNRGGNRAAPQGGGLPPGGGFGGGGGGFGGGGPRGGGGFGGGGGRRGGFPGGNDTTEHRYNITIGVTFTNLLNHFNPSGYQGALNSTQFGEPTTVNTGFGGGGQGGLQGGGPAGQGSAANNRRIEFQTRFTF